jgi:uncharacterized membrane protein YoaK (UPF0700 family)
VKFRHWWTALTAIYAAGLSAILQPDPWMLWLWLGVLVFMSAGAAGIILIRRQMEFGKPKWDTVIAMLVAFLSFIVLAVQSAVMETRNYENVGFVFASLGFGMVLVVVCFLSAYDRPEQTSIW